MATKKQSKSEDRTDIKFVGGPFDGREVTFVYPCQPYLIMDKGRALYVKVSREIYHYSTNWEIVDKLRKEMENDKPKDNNKNN